MQMAFFQQSNKEQTMNQDRQIRVYISSTFSDMIRERDLLAKEVFPALRRKCDRRGVAFTEVDLRRGITEAEANEGQMLPLCLAEIERSRPYFIGLLGESYGSIPVAVEPEVIEREPWLKEHIQRRTSVTELEILHAVLNHPGMRHHAFFYFRDPAYAEDPALTDEALPDASGSGIASNFGKYAKTEASRRAKEEQDKLSELKQRIRDSKLPLVDSYHDPEALAEFVRKQFNELIDKLYPEDQVPDPPAQERIAHEAAAKNKLFACIDRPAHLEALNAFAAPIVHDGKGLVVTGESGGGKTVLLAAWAHDWAKNHPADFLFQHYFGATPGSASPDGFLRRLFGELKNSFGITDDIPSDSESLREDLPLWLAQTIGKARPVLVLGGLDQVQGSEAGRRLHFLPRHFPPHVVVIASTLPGPALDALRERGWPELELPRAGEAEMNAMADEYPDIRVLELEPDLRRDLVTAPGAGTPLFLRTVLEELRRCGSSERLPQLLSYYRIAVDAKDLFLRVLSRWQADLDSKDAESGHPQVDLVRRALTHLWAARRGLSEPEWLDLLGDGSHPLPRAFWTPLFLALEPHLCRHDGVFSFGNDVMRQAVETAFLPSADAKRAAHLALADYFDHHIHQKGLPPRKTAEWPYQLHAAEAWQRLEACLVNLQVFLSLHNIREQAELERYWRSLGAQGADMGLLYLQSFARAERDGRHALSQRAVVPLGHFLAHHNFYLAADSLLRKAVAIYTQTHGEDHLETMQCQSDLALYLFRKGNLREAISIGQRVLDVRLEHLGREHHQTIEATIQLARSLESSRRSGEAEHVYENALNPRPKMLWGFEYRLFSLMNNYGRYLAQRGFLKSANEQYTEAMHGFEMALGPHHPYTMACLANIGSCALRSGKLAEAEKHLHNLLDYSTKTYGSQHLGTLIALNNLAAVLRAKKDLDGAERLHQSAINGILDISARNKKQHPDFEIFWSNYADTLAAKGIREKEIMSMRKNYLKSIVSGKSALIDSDDAEAGTAADRAKMEVGYLLQFIVPGLALIAGLWFLIKIFGK